MNELCQAMLQAGLTPPANISVDGNLHRFDVEGDRPRSKNGWYVAHSDPPAWAFGCWKRGLSETGNGKPYLSLTDAEKARHRANLKTQKQQRDAEQARLYEECRERAKEIWEQAEPAPSDHVYLKRKGIKPNGAKIHKGRLVIPLRATDGTLHGLQFIDADGSKRFLTGTAKAGHYFSIGGRPDSVLYLAEGFATGASIHEATGAPVAVAFDAGNLQPVAEALREKFPELKLVVCGDDDRDTDGNPGRAKAIDAAQVAGGWLTFPAFEDGEPGSDFNDMATTCGLESVRHQIESATRSAQPVTDSAEDWREPLPLPDGLHSVESFDFALLPDTLRPWAQDICERVQCPPDFVAVGIMAGLGALIGRTVGIRPQARTDWTVTPNQWALSVGRPGVLKSPALEQALTPLKRLAAQAAESHAQAMAEYKATAQIAKLRAEAREKSARAKLKANPDADLLAVLAVDEEAEPTLKRYLATDATPAALGELLRQNHNGLLIYRDELVSLLRNLDREDQAEGRGFYLTGWNGDSGYTFDRIGRGMNLHIPAVCLSVLGSTQPGRLAEYIRHAVKGGAADDGLIQRFGLLVWPDTGGTWKNVDRWPDGDAKRGAFKIFDRLAKLKPSDVSAAQDRDHDGEPDGIPYLRFDNAAHELFLEWRTDLEHRLRAGELHPALESHLAKYRKLIPGLALILHLADGGSGPVSERATLQALAWSEYLESHALRAYGSGTQPETATAKAILARIRKGDLPNEFSSRDVWRPGWALLSDREQVADALHLLVDHHYLVEARISDTGGRPATLFTANPRGLK